MPWLKVKDSDFLLDYPMRRVDHEDGLHFHYEEDLTSPPKRIRLTPTLVEDHGDGTFTHWGGLGPFGCVGTTYLHTGKVELVPLKTKADFTEAARLEAMIEESKCRSQMWYELYKNKQVHGEGSIT
jgi:hypothetical protein